MLTSTGLLVHWHTSVPPAKFGEPDFAPLSTAGWIEIVAIACPPNVGTDAIAAPRRTSPRFVRQFALRTSNGAVQAAALLREVSIYVRFFAYWRVVILEVFSCKGNLHRISKNGTCILEKRKLHR